MRANYIRDRSKTWLPLALWFLCLSLVTAHAQTRVALVSTCGGESGQNVLALAEAKLSAEKGVALVERALVERVLDEQKLTRCGLSDSAQALAVGKLLGVEVFATLETFPDSQETLGLVVFDARSGAKLWDATLPGGGPEKTAEGIVTAVHEACEKRLRPATKLRTICLLSVRNAELPRAMDSFCESVGQLLERDLLGSASLTVLERERLEQINRERLLPTNEVPNDLLPSLTLLELEFSRDSESSGVKVTVFLTDASGASLGKVQAAGRTEAATDLVELLFQKLIRSLNAAPALATVDRPREAQRFRQQAAFAMAHDLATKALQAAEAACALEPTNQESRALLAETLFKAASGLLGQSHSREDLRRGLSLAHRGADICLTIRAGMPNAGSVRFGSSEEEKAFYYFVTAGTHSLGAYDDETRREFVQLQKQYRRLLVEFWEKPALVRTMGYSVGNYVSDLYWFMEDLEVASPTSKEWVAAVVDALNNWLQLQDEIGCDSFVESMNWTLSPVVYRVRDPGAHDTFHARCWSFDEADYGRLRTVFDALKRHHNPLLRLYGLASELAATDRKEPVGREPVVAGLEEFKLLARDTIANPPCQDADDYRLAVYQAWLDTIDTLADPAVRRREYQDLFDFMMERREYVHGVAMAAVDPQPRRFAFYQHMCSVFPQDKTPGNVELCAQDLARLQSLLDSPECHKLKGRYLVVLDEELERVRQSIAEQRPDLILSKPAPWSAARLLYDGPSALLQPHVVNNAVWGLLLTGERATAPQVRLVRVPLDRSPAQQHDRIPPDGPADRFYAAAVRDGVLVFPPDRIPVSHFTETNGLPSSHVTAVACCDGKVYAGIGGSSDHPDSAGHYPHTAGYLIKCELATSQVTVLASSLRKEKLSALDDVSPPFFIRQMVADPAHHQVLFTVDIGMYKGGTPYSGLWSINTRDDRLVHVLPFKGYCEWVSPVRNSEFMFTRRMVEYMAEYEVFSFDLEKNKPRLLSSPAPDTKQFLNGKDPVYSIPWRSCPPHLIADNWLWVGEPFSRIPLNGGPREFLPSFIPGRATAYGQLKYLELLENGRQILAGVGNQLWLLDLKHTTPAAADPSKVSP